MPNKQTTKLPTKQITIRANGDKHWWQNDQFHRIDGPAVECANGDKYWYQNNQFIKQELANAK